MQVRYLDTVVYDCDAVIIDEIESDFRVRIILDRPGKVSFVHSIPIHHPIFRLGPPPFGERFVHPVLTGQIKFLDEAKNIVKLWNSDQPYRLNLRPDFHTSGVYSVVPVKGNDTISGLAAIKLTKEECLDVIRKMKGLSIDPVRLRMSYLWSYTSYINSEEINVSPTCLLKERQLKHINNLFVKSSYLEWFEPSYLLKRHFKNG